MTRWEYRRYLCQNRPDYRPPVFGNWLQDKPIVFRVTVRTIRRGNFIGIAAAARTDTVSSTGRHFPSPEVFRSVLYRISEYTL